jgi:hypothetical protein
MDAAARARFERHLGECASCQTEIAAQQEIWNALDAIGAETPAVSPGFDQQVYARIASEERDNFLLKICRRFFASGEPVEWRPSLSMAAACAVLFVMMVLGFRGNTAPVVAPEPKADLKMEAFEVEQAETALEDLEMLKLLKTTKL